ncbi:receptor-type tyrosine-protein phosphatase eta [Lates japonicus]|uniref:Receptor-type tyrosine-protein phosphatase eta n=1 Tax=Lates japonicus TaxID=270547 RepID=A0AAD3NDB8_LATJO|nr:receptor-type tyrosine-protein phosphatase eta [Lates japonicus]
MTTSHTVRLSPSVSVDASVAWFSGEKDPLEANMRTLSPKDRSCILISLALVFVFNAAEPEYFLQNSSFSWDEARNKCQVCFKELVTLTSSNTHTIAQNLTSDYWVGLRKYLDLDPDSDSISYSNGSHNRSWSRWANGDPLAFQNWYPGWPVLKSPLPKIDCCSCSCTCPAATTPGPTSFTGYTEFTTPNMTNFSLFEDMTENVTDITGFTNFTDQNVTDYTTTPRAQLLPIEAECVRSPMLLPEVPQTDENYIEDSCVAMLSFGAWVEKNCADHLPYICYEDRFFGKANVTGVTVASASLSWERGPGDIDHYRVEVNQQPLQNFTNGLSLELSNLTAGTGYSVQVFAVKCERDLNPQNVTFYTKPGKVSNLRVVQNTNISLVIKFELPEGNVTQFRVEAVNDSNHNLFEMVKSVSGKTEEVKIEPLLEGTKITISVTALVNGTVEGDKVTIVNYTAPGPISNLHLTTKANSLNATWSPPPGNFSSFTIKLNLEGKTEQTIKDRREPNQYFDKLKTAANYTVIVYSVSGHLYGPPVECSKFTLPLPPTNAKVDSSTKTQLSFKWTAPENIQTAKYSVKLESKFWNHNLSFEVDNITNYTFRNLISGTRYNFEVRTVTEDQISDAENISHCTEPDKREISLSMLCSSSEPLHCANDNIKESVFQQLKRRFADLFKDQVFWELKKQESENA